MKKLQLVKDRSFYKAFFSIWSVLVLHNIITLGVNLLDNVMVSAYSEAAMAGVSAVNQVQFLFQQLMLGAGDAVVVLGSQYWGQKRTEPIKRFAVGALLLGAALSMVFFTVSAIAPAAVVSLFTDDPAIHAAGVEYLRVMKYSFLIFALTNLLLSVLRSVETVRIGFWVSLSTLLVNGGLNYLLIEGHLGFPRLGVTGAAIATLSARVVELCVVAVYLLCIDKKLQWRLRDLFSWDRLLVKDYLKLVRSFLLTSLLFGGAVMLQTVILGHMEDTGGGGSTIAANSIASTLYQMLKVAIVGASSAAAVLIGKAIGSGKMEDIRSYAQTLQLMFVGIGVCTSTALFLLRAPIVGLYAAISPDLSAETAQMALDFLAVLCVTGFGTAYQMPVATGIIRGGGDARFVLINDLISIWGIVLPVSFLAAFVFKWPPVAVIACLNADQVFKCGAAGIKVNRYTWMKKLTRKEE
ncbi:MAG: MATE family efflux transporter [Clostridia bacterium]|nr:MATE family efflux transporter [Clostridia bacterium]